jgi:hypothetical protein
VDESTDLDVLLQRWSVPSDVRDALLGAVESVARDGVQVTGDASAELITLAVRGQPAALYLSPSGVSAALVPADAERAHRADSALGLEKKDETSWLVHCRYGRLDPSRLNTMTALMVRALRRYAPAPAARSASARPTRRRTTTAGSRAGTSPAAKAPSARAERAGQEERRRVADAAVPRCPVPGCNLPMVGGSCGFHD